MKKSFVRESFMKMLFVKKSFIDYGLKVRLPIILFVAVASFAVTYYVSYAERNGIGYQPGQPVNFSHKIHAGDMKIDCRYCHIGVDKSRIASIPTVSVCMGCHLVARKDKTEIQKLIEYYEQNKPVGWKRIHKVPEFVYFNHSVHVTNGIECQSCHGDVQKMDVVGQVSSFTMGACLDCHRNAHDKLPYLKNIKNGPDNCAACHR